MVDERGRTDVRNLYAIGEVAMTGLHGACRLASNSLLEALVFARARRGRRAPRRGRRARRTWRPGTRARPASSDEAVVVSHNWDEIRRLMWNYVGIVRSDRRLERAARRIDADPRGDPRLLLELRSSPATSSSCATSRWSRDLIIECARRRKESRGLHFNLDHPDHDPRLAHDTIVVRGDGPVL